MMDEIVDYDNRSRFFASQLIPGSVKQRAGIYFWFNTIVMKNLIILVVIGAILFTVLLFTCSCTKQYEQKPTCFRYMELHKRFDGELRYVATDTVYPSGKLASIACGDDIARLQNYVDSTHGCIGGGFDSVYYKIIR
jgi:hypothetical protein